MKKVLFRFVSYVFIILFFLFFCFFVDVVVVVVHMLCLVFVKKRPCLCCEKK